MKRGRTHPRLFRPILGIQGSDEDRDWEPLAEFREQIPLAAKGSCAHKTRSLVALPNACLTLVQKAIAAKGVSEPSAEFFKLRGFRTVERIQL